MISDMLMVNDSKTEFLIVGSKQQLERVNIPCVHVGEDRITPVTSVRNLGVIFDSNLKMDLQITKACQNAYYHLHNIRRIRKFLSHEATCTVIHAFITSQIDYCNCLMNGLPENLIKKLQHVQNTAARLVFNLRKYDCITPALVTLHWLPVKYRIEFKTVLIVFKGLHGKAPTYIQEMIIPSKSKRYSIRSNEERVLKVPKFKHDTFGKRAFAVYGPLAWNCLPKEIRLCDEIEAFKRNLKTHLFVKFVNESTLAIWFWRIIVKRPRMLSAQFVALYEPCKPKPKPKHWYQLLISLAHIICFFHPQAWHWYRLLIWLAHIIICFLPAGLTLVSAPHLAFSYHHLFSPPQAWQWCQLLISLAHIICFSPRRPDIGISSSSDSLISSSVFSLQAWHWYQLLILLAHSINCFFPAGLTLVSAPHLAHLIIFFPSSVFPQQVSHWYPLISLDHIICFSPRRSDIGIGSSSHSLMSSSAVFPTGLTLVSAPHLARSYHHLFFPHRPDVGIHYSSCSLISSSAFCPTGLTLVSAPHLAHSSSSSSSSVFPQQVSHWYPLFISLAHIICYFPHRSHIGIGSSSRSLVSSVFSPTGLTLVSAPHLTCSYHLLFSPQVSHWYWLLISLARIICFFPHRPDVGIRSSSRSLISSSVFSPHRPDVGIRSSSRSLISSSVSHENLSGDEGRHRAGWQQVNNILTLYWLNSY